MKGRSYLSIGGVSMGIAGSTVEPDFFQSYLGMRNEFVDSTEVFRRIEKGIYDKDEFKMALKWTKENCKEGKDYNEADKQRSRKEKDGDWEFVGKMTLIKRDFMEGNRKLEEMGIGKEYLGARKSIG